MVVSWSRPATVVVERLVAAVPAVIVARLRLSASATVAPAAVLTAAS
jgi:hypothetical protein